MKAKKIITIVVTVIAAGMAILSGISKLAGAEQVVNNLSKAGIGNFVYLLGIMEIVFAALFLYPKTMKAGFILLSCYFAGAMAVELSQTQTVTGALIPQIFLWISAFLRNKNIFLPAEKEKQFVVS